MKYVRSLAAVGALLSFVVLLPLSALAHEVYILPDDTIEAALQTPGFSLWQVMLGSLDMFFMWVFIGVFVVMSVFFISISRTFERIFDPLLAKLPPYAPVICRVTVGLSFLAAAYSQALFGPELPLSDTFGVASPVVTGVLAIAGVMMVFGVYARLAAMAGLVLYGAEVVVHGAYLFTYTNYAADLLVVAILGAHQVAVHHRGHDQARAPAWFLRLKERLTPYAFLILRVGFGVSLLYASVYAKIIHNNLALAVTQEYPELVAFFGFQPDFLVLGAAIVEIVIGLFFTFGIEIRFTSLFLLFWLALSLWYFGEAVWPHVILIGIPLAFFCYGYDKYSLEGYFFKRNGREPVL